MGKKIRYQYLLGSMLQPPLRYTQKLQICTNSISDPQGTKLAKAWHHLGTKGNPILKQPNFQCTIVEDFKSSTSYMIADFVNGWRHGIYLRGSNQQEVEAILGQINEHIEFERTLQGHDDEYEDEMEP